MKDYQNKINTANTLFFTLVGSGETVKNACLMIKSLRTFGGRFSECPVWVFLASPEQPVEDLDALDNTQIIPLRATHNIQPYLFRAKVHACAQAEEQAGPQVQSLVWMNPQSLVVKPPDLFDLSPSHQASFRTVHIQNIGSLSDQPLDGYWRGVYQAAGIEDTQYSLESYVDAQRIRPYFNSHLFAVDPKIGLLQKWRDIFEQMVFDSEYQSSHCADIPHKVFLHQAVLSALALKMLDWEKIRWLPPGYSYPLHFHPKVPGNLRPQTLNDLVCPVYEEKYHYPDTLNGIAVNEPLQSWLVNY